MLSNIIDYNSYDFEIFGGWSDAQGSKKGVCEVWDNLRVCYSWFFMSNTTRENNNTQLKQITTTISIILIIF